MKPAATRSLLRSISERDSQTLALPDGRLLGYAEYGHSTGRPILFLHGFPVSRLEALALDKIARRRRLRVISPDRPGFGLSTFQPRRRIADWPADVSALAAHLKLGRFAIMGTSGGSPYALACAHALPRETMSAVGIMGGMGSFDPGTKHIPMGSWTLGMASQYWPAGVRIVADALMGAIRWVATTGMVTRWIDGFLEESSRKKKEAAAAAAVEGSATAEEEPDEAAEEEAQLSTAERRERLLRTLFDGFAQGAKGMVQEAQLVSQDWGFRLEDVSYDPILLWHGTKDSNSPIGWVRSMAERLPNGVLKEFEGDTHFTIVNHLDKILSDLVPDETSAKSSDGTAAQ
ncbi:Alpha/Beta hydrolase protein [Phialemonium atrogriseum]|uniref:Alpha/Beta hydrolase protein n=1 Tax=Phialemonium atrogriseum TaxID=1093897 RepID=A0AAJ0C028_9PEZI|nr:Alpha/Beta hydrolase protein [Phialemonium atrogriseum]KAK1765216.1 Alpha/Beta hydrolase protein [Phialemonium atrogriseum]